jgi:hypothetical protein
LNPNVCYFFDKQTFADTPIDYRCAPLADLCVTGLKLLLSTQSSRSL